MSVAYREWHFVLVDGQTGASIDDDSGQLLVLTAGAPTAPTIYSDDKGTSVSNAIRTPRTFSNGRVRFWTDRSTTSVDLFVCTAKGQSYFLEDVPFSQHRIKIDSKDREFVFVMPFGANDNSELDSGLDLPVANMLVKDAYLRVSTADSTETIEIGILASESGGDADGFVDAASVGTAGYVNLWPTVTGGTNIDYHDATAGFGVFLSQSIAGADAVATVGGFERRYYRTDGTAKSLSYTGSAGSDTAAGYLYLPYTLLP